MPAQVETSIQTFTMSCIYGQTHKCITHYSSNNKELTLISRVIGGYSHVQEGGLHLSNQVNKYALTSEVQLC